MLELYNKADLFEFFMLPRARIDILGKVPEHRITGQFRSKSSRIWDPHPEYLIDAFGFHLHLILKQDSSFIPKDMKVSDIENRLNLMVQYFISYKPLSNQTVQ